MGHPVHVIRCVFTGYSYYYDVRVPNTQVSGHVYFQGAAAAFPSEPLETAPKHPTCIVKTQNDDMLPPPPPQRA